MRWHCVHHGLFMVKPALDTFDLDAKLVDPMLLRRYLLLELCLRAGQVSQFSLVLANDLLLIF